MDANIKSERQVAARQFEKRIGTQRKAQPYGCAFLLCVCSWGDVELHHKTRNRPQFYVARLCVFIITYLSFSKPKANVNRDRFRLFLYGIYGQIDDYKYAAN